MKQMCLPAGESMWIHLGLIKTMINFSKELFPVCSYGSTLVPSYPCGQIGFMLCSKNPNTKFTEPLRVFSEEEMTNMKLQYYDEDMHRTAFMLPRFVKKALGF